MSPSIEELVSLSETLNTESNDLNKTIAAISDKLAALNLGIEVWFDAELPNVEVGFAKVYEAPGKEGWQLAVRYGGKGGSPLRTANRDMRIEGLRRVPAIVQDLKKEAEARIRVMQEAKRLAGEL
jgi:hypothetical protein